MQMITRIGLSSRVCISSLPASKSRGHTKTRGLRTNVPAWKIPQAPYRFSSLRRLNFSVGNKEVALQNLAAAARLKPDFAAAYYAASQIYASTNDLQNALAAAALATQYAPQDPLAWYNAGAIAYAAKDYPNAIVALEQALTLQSNYANAAYVLGLAYYDAGRAADSLKVFEALGALDPGQQVVQNAIQNLRAGLSPTATSTPQTR